MTDSTHDTFDGLIERYELSVSQTDSDIIPALEARSAIEAQHAQLSEAQLVRVADADKILIRNADAFAPKVTASEMAGRTHPTNEWWWHLDVLAPVADYFTPGGAPVTDPRSQLASRLFTALEVVVLIVAIFLLARNFGVFQPGATPTASPFPTSTPTIAPTLNADAFDISKATLYKSANDVVEIMLPPTWQSQAGPDQSGNTVYNFAYGDPQNPTALIGVQLPVAQTFYKGMDPTGASNTPQAALTALIARIKANNATGQGPLPKVSEVKPVKVGSLDGQGFTLSSPADPQTGAPSSEVDIRLALIPNSTQAAYIITQGQTATWATVQPIVGKMIDSLVVKPQNIPTATPTATLFPLQITATALQKQFIALTPTNTPTPIGTGAATLGATSNATSNATMAANATSAATTSANATTGSTMAATSAANSASAATMAATSSTNATPSVSTAAAVPTSAATVAAAGTAPGSVITTADGLKYTEFGCRDGSRCQSRR